MYIHVLLTEAVMNTAFRLFYSYYRSILVTIELCGGGEGENIDYIYKYSFYVGGTYPYIVHACAYNAEHTVVVVKTRRQHTHVRCAYGACQYQYQHVRR